MFFISDLNLFLFYWQRRKSVSYAASLPFLKEIAIRKGLKIGLPDNAAARHSARGKPSEINTRRVVVEENGDADDCDGGGTTKNPGRVGHGGQKGVFLLFS